MPRHAHSIDRWDDATGSNLYEQTGRRARSPVGDIPGRDQATTPAPRSRLRNGARIIEKIWPADD